MIHSFDTEIAKEYGVNAAIVLNNIYFWTEKNRANGENMHDGRAWTYNSKRAFSELFPYFTERQIEYTLDKLREAGIVVTGNYNKNPYDKTLWYAITDKGYSILQNCAFDSTKLWNGEPQNVEPIPDIKPNDKTTDIKPNINQKKNATALPSDDIEKEFELLWTLYPRKQGKANAAKAYAKVRKNNPDIYKTVENGIHAYIAYLKANKTEQRFIKQGSTWFNQNCWKDDYTLEGDNNGGIAKTDSTENGYDWDSIGINL